MLGMGCTAVWAFILAIIGLCKLDRVCKVVTRQSVFRTSYEVTGVACERWGGVVEFDMTVSVSGVCEELWAI